MDVEERAPVQGFPGYTVSSLGYVARDLNGRVLTIKVNQYGVPYVGLMRNGVQCQRSLAKLVAKAFIPNNSEFFDTPINLDGNRFNCSVENLMWRPRWFAVQFHRQFKSSLRPLGGSVRAIETEEVFGSPFEAACRYGLLERSVVESVKQGKPTWPNYIHFERID